ncbi:hypothetical protein [Escherichia phage FL33]|uniref:Uncharacterized protein n=1 Tax=Escherichia phage FL33 TaxID=3128059 RepID=A0AAX4R5E9_9CAUD
MILKTRWYDLDDGMMAFQLIELTGMAVPKI